MAAQHRTRFVGILASAMLAWTGCSEHSSPDSPESVAEAPRDFESRAGAADQEVIIAWKNTFGPAERALLAQATRRPIKYEFRGFPAVAIWVPRQAIAALRANPLVRYISEGLPIFPTQSPNPEVVGWQFRIKPDGHGFSQVPSPPPCSYPNPCLLNNVNSNGNGVGVAILDTGIHCTLRDFFTPCAGGADFTGEGTPFKDSFPHGTLVASLIKATGGSPSGIGAENGGIKGIAPSASVYSLRVFNSQRVGDCKWSALAIDHATFNLPSTVSIINVSYGSAATTAAQKAAYDQKCQAEKDAIAQAVAARMFIAASAGNRSQLGDSVGFPARLPGVLAVSGLDTPVTGTCPTFGVTNCKTFFWTGSSRGTQVGIAAAAAKVTAISPTNQLVTESGTSFAAPMVAGAVAAIYGRYGVGRRADCMIPHLKRFAYKPAGYTAVQYGAGVMDAQAAWNVSPLTSCP